MAGIFLCYRNIRRSYAPMLIDRELVRRFGPDNVFQAGRSNAPAVALDDEIFRRLARCSVLVALIDPHWVGEDLEKLFDPDDWVRKEIQFAIERDIAVLPLLLDGAAMPSRSALPREIEALQWRIAEHMTPQTVDADLPRLIGELERLAPDLVLATLTDTEPPPPSTPAALLRPEHAILPFRHRPELSRLLDWCLDPAGSPVRLVTGPAGAGKTRLGLELAARVRSDRRPAGLLSERAGVEALSRIDEIRRPTLIVLDDAETRPEAVRAAFRALAAAPSSPVRVLLLARTAGEWLDRLQYGAEDAVAALAGALLPMPLQPLTATDEDFAVAGEKFARQLGLAQPARSDSWPAGATLLDAQLVVLDRLGPLPESAATPLERLVAWELDYWRRAAGALGVPAPASDQLRELLTVVALFGADTEQEADDLLGAVRAYRGRPVGDIDGGRSLARAALPGPAPLNRLQPDVVGEALVAEYLRHGRPLAELAPVVSDTQAQRALITLGRCLGRAPDLSDRIVDFLAAAPERLLPLTMTALPAVDRPGPLVAALSAAAEKTPLSSLEALVVALPQRSEALARFAVDVTERALRAADEPGADPERVARLAGALATRLVHLGERSGEAVGFARRALDVLRTRPGPERAEAHAALALALGGGPEAIAAGASAIDEYDRQGSDDRRIRAALATALFNQARRLGDAGEAGPARDALHRAAELAAALHAEQPTRYRSLQTDVQELRALLDGDVELLAGDVLESRRALAAARPDAYRPGLAATLYNLGRLELPRDPDVARDRWRESAALYAALATEWPGRYDADRGLVERALDEPPDQFAAVLRRAGVTGPNLRRGDLEAIAGLLGVGWADEFIAPALDVPGLSWDDGRPRPDGYFEIHGADWSIDASGTETRRRLVTVVVSAALVDALELDFGIEWVAAAVPHLLAIDAVTADGRGLRIEARRLPASAARPPELADTVHVDDWAGVVAALTSASEEVSFSGGGTLILRR